MPTMRDRFLNVAGELLDERPDLAVVLADIGYGYFQQAGVVTRHPGRVLNVGIREQLLIGFAAGLAMEGLRPIVHSYAPFLIERPFEQVKLDFGHQGLGGVFVSVGASYDAAAAGRTHQAPEDVALMSTLPGWRVHVPGHPDEVEAILRSTAAGTGLDYIRLAESANPQAAPNSGGLTPIRRGSARAVTVIAIGPSLAPVLEATADLDTTVLYASTVRPFDGVGLRTYLAAPDVVLVEPYLAGTSSAEVSTALRDCPHRLLALGVALREHRRYGSRWEHDRAHGLDAAGIRRSVTDFLALAA
ncbi:MAG: transketolase [Chloroflexi bacterium]|nr:transketolase [Chloroflexota bacterium]